MLLHSVRRSAYVDLADGYSFLPFVEPQITARSAKWTPEEISVILHEFTHQFALKGPFGTLCAYHQAMRAQLRELAETEAEGRLHVTLPFTDSLDRDTSLSRLSSDDLANYTDLFSIFRYWLEGIAMFTQLDFAISKQFNSASAAYSILLALWNCDLHRYTQESPIPTESPELEDILIQVAPRLASEADIAKLMEEVNLTQFNGLRSLLLATPDPTHTPYFVGYLLVRRIQRLLVEKDRRLADPEMFYIFINAFLFFDSKLLDLCRTLPRTEYQHRLSLHLGEKVQILIDVSTTHLRTTVDAICDYEHAEVNFAHLDVTASLQVGRLMSWNSASLHDNITAGVKEALRKRCSSKDAVLCRYLLHKVPDFEQDQVDSSVSLINQLGLVMKYFKLHHGFLGVLGCNMDNNRCYLTSQALDRSCTFIGEPLPRSTGVELQKIIREHSYEVASTSKLSSSASEAFLKDGIVGIHRDILKLNKQGRLLTLEFFEAYSLLSNQRIHIRFRESFYHVRTYFQMPHLSGPHGDLSPEETEMLGKARGFLSPRNYYERISLPPEIIQQNAVPDDDFVTREVIRWWRQLFPAGRAADSELWALAEQKLGLLCLQPQDRSLIDALCEAAITPASIEHLVAAERLNRRWCYYTGELLIVNAKEDEIQLTFAI